MMMYNYNLCYLISSKSTTLFSFKDFFAAKAIFKESSPALIPHEISFFLIRQFINSFIIDIYDCEYLSKKKPKGLE